jgi:predicted MarR family transcription regulator
VSNDFIAWVQFRPSDDARVRAHMISMNTSQAVSKEEARSVALNNSYIAWSTWHVTAVAASFAIEVYSIADGRITTVVEPDSEDKRVIGITDNNTLIYKLGDDKLYALKIAVEEKP